MNFLELAKNRYTTKKYDASKSISEETIAQLKEILHLSPSSINSQPWKFTFVTDKETKTKLAEVSYFNEPKVNDSSLLVVFSVIDDIAKFEKNMGKYMPERAISYYDTKIKIQPESNIKAWLGHQVYVSLGYFLSAVASMGLDSTPMEGIQSEKYDEILSLKGYKTLFAVAVGHRANDDSNQPSITPKSRLPIEDVIKSI